MAHLDTDEANIVDVEEFNWRPIVYSLLIIILVVVGGLGIYYYQLQQREDLEANARTALIAAKTPAEWQKVAEQYPNSTQATLALMNAADAAFTKHDFAGAIANYQKITSSSSTDPGLHDSAQFGLAASLEANGKVDDAINANLDVARKGAKSPFAPYAYFAAARLYEERGDKDNERKILTEAASLDPDSAFVKQIQFKLKQMTAAAQPPMPPASISAPAAPAATAAPTPTATEMPTPVAPPAKH